MNLIYAYYVLNINNRSALLCILESGYKIKNVDNVLKLK